PLSRCRGVCTDPGRRRGRLRLGCPRRVSRGGLLPLRPGVRRDDAGGSRRCARTRRGGRDLTLPRRLLTSTGARSGRVHQGRKGGGRWRQGHSWLMPSLFPVHGAAPTASAQTLRDALGRPLRSLRLSVTDRCNLRCTYCMPEPEYVWLPKKELLTFEELDRIT